MPNKFSIIIPAFNASKYIEETLQSIENQTYNNWEIIIIDDGSTDNTKEIIWPYLSDKIKYYYQDNAGTAVARNKGLMESVGDFILPLDADDTLNPKALEELLNAVNENPDYLIIYSDTYIFGDSSDLSNVPANLLIKDILVRNQIFNTSLFQKKDIKDHIRYDAEILNGPEDWEFWLQLRSTYPDRPVKKIDYPIFNYRNIATSKSKKVQKDQENLDRNYRYIYNKHRALYDIHFTNFIDLLNRKQFYEKKLEKFYQNPLYKIYDYLKKLIA